MTITEFLHNLFTLNVVDRMTDDELRLTIRARFPKSMLDVPLGNHSNRLALWRSDYNRGRLGRRPIHLSLRYNKDKVPCNQYEHALSRDAIIDRVRKFNRRWKDSNAGTNNQPRIDDCSDNPDRRKN